MDFNNHFRLEGLHAFLGASNYHWINYDEDKLMSTYLKKQQMQIGTETHELAKRLINLGVKLPKTNKTLNMYVNDAIGFKMTPEQILYFSDNCFGTADAISFKKNFLRIHDLKTGESPTSEKQLLIYSALFCLEYHINPNDIEIELRIYQLDEVRIFIPEKEDVLFVMGKIMTFDKCIDKLKTGG